MGKRGIAYLLSINLGGEKTKKGESSNGEKVGKDRDSLYNLAGINTDQRGGGKYIEELIITL